MVSFAEGDGESHPFASSPTLLAKKETHTSAAVLRWRLLGASTGGTDSHHNSLTGVAGNPLACFPSPLSGTRISPGTSPQSGVYPFQLLQPQQLKPRRQAPCRAREVEVRTNAPGYSFDYEGWPLGIVPGLTS